MWIGFKILYLCDLKQSALPNGRFGHSCELVSKFCIFVIWNSKGVFLTDTAVVVNWFQNFVSLWSETVYFSTGDHASGCELVSKFCIFVIWNSIDNDKVPKDWLWIGFKILYLCDLKQCRWLTNHSSFCCELVSKFCIFVIWNSPIVPNSTIPGLWIGFKILYLCDLKQ